MASSLTPLPKGSRTLDDDDDKDDLFATLFSPPTPRASPIPSTSLAGSDVSRPSHEHARTASTDSEFGAFVSIPSSEGPLHSTASEVNAEMASLPPIQNVDFLDKFTKGARAATERNKQVLKALGVQLLLRHLHMLRVPCQTRTHKNSL
ncbi:uncharacterized protein LAESUDRAFT_242399 [Laetiporus sulphureus 93-53]|uniref:Uncharacterized protein n=1 Tax=Laetiporus sulphureus 93-53 TaxID=1314785 RepID=A0A165DL00_9APHY|nr:uncharacterized protein LAESUDRAFT_242399 [Laetiporus sulphureus 93-53]KZT05113.1 hypothetical protein LAESUDRAFT_242399 [Laetiporus sulphureus 93-53]